MSSIVCAAWRPPCMVAEDRNQNDQTPYRIVERWRPPTAVAEDRNNEIRGVENATFS